MLFSCARTSYCFATTLEENWKCYFKYRKAVLKIWKAVKYRKFASNFPLSTPFWKLNLGPSTFIVEMVISMQDFLWLLLLNSWRFEAINILWVCFSRNWTVIPKFLGDQKTRWIGCTMQSPYFPCCGIERIHHECKRLLVRRMDKSSQ